MDNLTNFGIQVITWLQGLGTWLKTPMELFSFSGVEQFYLLVAPAIYWCVDASLGLKLGIFLLVSSEVNSYLKFIFHAGRPFWISASINPLAFESSFSMPSGHAQNAMVLWGALAAHFRKRWVWAVAVFFIVMIGLSRIYLGVHFPQDVLAGWVAGLLVLWLLLTLTRPVTRWINHYRMSMKVILTFAGSMVLILLGVLSFLALNGFTLPPEWVTNAAAAFPEEARLDPAVLSGIISNSGTFFGLVAGAFWIKTQGGFSVSGTLLQKIARYVIGVMGVVIFWFGLDLIFPQGETLIPYIFRFLRYGLVGCWVNALAPMLFIKMKIAEKASK